MLQGKTKIATGGRKHLGRLKKTSDGAFEEKLVKHIKPMESRLFGLAFIELRRLAERNKLKYQFIRTKAMADKPWLKLFLNANHLCL